MKSKLLQFVLPAVLFVFSLGDVFGQQAPGTLSIEVVATFEYPGKAPTSTLPTGINNRGDVTGLIISHGAIRGFVRFQSGRLSKPIIEPNEGPHFSQGRGINDARTVAGYYLGSDFLFHSFFLNGRTFTEYDVPGANSTSVEGLNDAGDFVGSFDTDTHDFVAFSNIGGAITSIDIPGAIASDALGINASGEIAGNYIDAAGVAHGWRQDSAGALHLFDVPGSTQTLPWGIGDQGLIAGRFTDGSSGVERGFVFRPEENDYVLFDYPGAVLTSFNGINADGLICGRYEDASGLSHGILAQLVTEP